MQYKKVYFVKAVNIVSFDAQNVIALSRFFLSFPVSSKTCPPAKFYALCYFCVLYGCSNGFKGIIKPEATICRCQNISRVVLKEAIYLPSACFASSLATSARLHNASLTVVSPQDLLFSRPIAPCSEFLYSCLCVCYVLINSSYLLYYLLTYFFHSTSSAGFKSAQ